MKASYFLWIALLLSAPSAWATPNAVKVHVKGMVCGFCAQGIEKKFHAQSAVDEVKVSLGQRQVELTLKSGQTLSDDTIRTLLTEAGYNVESIERN